MPSEWGRYDRFEGPFSTGRWPLEPSRPGDSPARRTLAVIASTEGAAYDAVNMYDRMIFSVGLIQFADAAPVFNACAVFQAIARRAPRALDPLLRHVGQRGYTFDARAGRFRDRSGALVNSVEAQRALYLGGVSGETGSWTNEAQTWALALPSAVSAVFDSAEARAAHLDFATAFVDNYVTGPAATRLAPPQPGVPDALVWAVRAVYASYSANLPAVAARALATVDDANKWSPAWVERVLRALVFGPRIAIYPERYRKVRPAIAREFGVTLPRLGLEPEVAEVQSALIARGFSDLRADGLWGPKSQAALDAYAKARGVPARRDDTAMLIALGLG